MRVTNNMLTRGYLNNMSRNLKQMQKLQHQGSTGKRVSKPSDDPVVVGKIMMLKNTIGENQNYNKTIGDAQGWTEAQDRALDGAAKSMRRIRDLTISAAKDSLSATDRKAIKDEIEAEIGSLKDVFNTNFDGRYVFGGKKTDRRPFDENLVYSGDDSNISREIGKGIEVELITDGSRLVKVDGSDLREVLVDLIYELENFQDGSLESLSGKHLKNIDRHMDHIVSMRSQIGAIDNRLEAAMARNEEENISLKTILSEKEDVDIVENYIESTVMATVYQASLSMGARILQPSLLDYLR